MVVRRGECLAPLNRFRSEYGSIGTRRGDASASLPSTRWRSLAHAGRSPDGAPCAGRRSLCDRTALAFRSAWVDGAAPSLASARRGRAPARSSASPTRAPSNAGASSNPFASSRSAAPSRSAFSPASPLSAWIDGLARWRRTASAHLGPRRIRRSILPPGRLRLNGEHQGETNQGLRPLKSARSPWLAASVSGRAPRGWTAMRSDATVEIDIPGRIAVQSRRPWPGLSSWRSTHSRTFQTRPDENDSAQQA